MRNSCLSIPAAILHGEHCSRTIFSSPLASFVFSSLTFTVFVFFFAFFVSTHFFFFPVFPFILLSVTVRHFTGVYLLHVRLRAVKIGKGARHLAEKGKNRILGVLAIFSRF